jgi:transposase
MARKNYSEEFCQQAVDLYESTPEATLRGIAEDLGIVRGTLRQWLETHGSGKKTAADGVTLSAEWRGSGFFGRFVAGSGDTDDQGAL